MEAFGLGVVSVRVRAIGNEDQIVGDARVSEILSLGSSLVAEAGQTDRVNDDDAMGCSESVRTQERRSSCHAERPD